MDIDSKRRSIKYGRVLEFMVICISALGMMGYFVKRYRWRSIAAFIVYTGIVLVTELICLVVASLFSGLGSV
jgi:hypothetical protein